MESLTSLVTAPLSVISQVVIGDQAITSGSATQAGPFDEDTLQRLVYNVFQGDARVQQAALDELYADDVKFNDGLISLEGREQLAKLLTGFTTLADIKPDIIELSIGPSRALILVNLRLAWRFLPWTFWRRLTVPLTISLTYTSSLMGGGSITGHVHHMSHMGLLWYGQNPVADWLVTRGWCPRSGLLLSLAEAAAETITASWDHTIGRFYAERKAGASLLDASIATVKSTTALLTHGPKGVPAPPTPSPTAALGNSQMLSASPPPPQAVGTTPPAAASPSPSSAVSASPPASPGQVFTTPSASPPRSPVEAAGWTQGSPGATVAAAEAAGATPTAVGDVAPGPDAPEAEAALPPVKGGTAAAAGAEFKFEAAAEPPAGPQEPHYPSMLPLSDIPVATVTASAAE